MQMTRMKVISACHAMTLTDTLSVEPDSQSPVDCIISNRSTS